MSMSAQDLLVQLFRHRLKSWLLSPFSSSSTGFLLILQGLLISLHSHSSLFLWLLVMVRTGAEWTGSFFVQSEMILFCPPTPVPPLTFCVMVPLALQLRLHWAHCMLRLWCFPHLLRCSHQSYFGQYLNPAQLPVCSEGLLLSTVCTWVGLLASSCAKKAASFREGFACNSFVNWLQRCLSYCCSSFTAHLHFTKYSPMKLQKSK